MMIDYICHNQEERREYITAMAALEMMGLHLQEDDHFVVLKERDKVIAMWSTSGITIGEIRNETDRLEKQTQKEAIAV